MAMPRNGKCKTTLLQPVQLLNCQTAKSLECSEEENKGRISFSLFNCGNAERRKMQDNPDSARSTAKLLNCEIAGMLKRGE